MELSEEEVKSIKTKIGNARWHMGIGEDELRFCSGDKFDIDALRYFFDEAVDELKKILKLLDKKKQG